MPPNPITIDAMINEARLTLAGRRDYLERFGPDKKGLQKSSQAVMDRARYRYQIQEAILETLEGLQDWKRHGQPQEKNTSTA